MRTSTRRAAETTSSPEVVNLTSHEVTLYEGGEILTRIPPADKPLKLHQGTERLGDVSYKDTRIPLFSYVDAASAEIPDLVEGRLYVVSTIIATRYSWRSDLVVPHDLVRAGDGRVIGCRGLARVGGAG